MTLPARNQIVCAGLMAVPLAVLIGHSLYFNFVCDDAFIFFRYADNLLRYGELSFNPGQRVEGYTSFLWTVLIAAGMALGSEPIIWSLGLGLICGCATLVVVQRLGTVLDGLVEPGQPRGAIRLWRFVAPALLSVTPAFACWTSGGLETALFTLLVTAAFWRYWAESGKPSAVPWSGLLFGLACLTRPEGFLFFGLTLLHRLVDQGLRCSRRRPARRDWIWLALFLLPVLPHQLWRISYYGQVLPNTYYARVAGLEHEGRGLLYLQMFVRHYGLWIILLLLVVPRAQPGGRRVTSFYTHLATLVLVVMVYVAGVGGDFMALHRFFVPVIPLLALVLADELRNLHALAVPSVPGTGPVFWLCTPLRRFSLQESCCIAHHCRVAAWKPAVPRGWTRSAISSGSPSRTPPSVVGWLNTRTRTLGSRPPLPGRFPSTAACGLTTCTA